MVKMGEEDNCKSCGKAGHKTKNSKQCKNYEEPKCGSCGKAGHKKNNQICENNKKKVQTTIVNALQFIIVSSLLYWCDIIKGNDGLMGTIVESDASDKKKKFKNINNVFPSTMIGLCQKYKFTGYLTISDQPVGVPDATNVFAHTKMVLFWSATHILVVNHSFPQELTNAFDLNNLRKEDFKIIGDNTSSKGQYAQHLTINVFNRLNPDGDMLLAFWRYVSNVTPNIVNSKFGRGEKAIYDNIVNEMKDAESDFEFTPYGSTETFVSRKALVGHKLTGKEISTTINPLKHLSKFGQFLFHGWMKGSGGAVNPSDPVGRRKLYRKNKKTGKVSNASHGVERLRYYNDVENILTFKDTQNHMKLAISTDAANKWVAFCDLNYIKSQCRRGGGALLIRDPIRCGHFYKCITQP